MPCHVLLLRRPEVAEGAGERLLLSVGADVVAQVPVGVGGVRAEGAGELLVLRAEPLQGEQGTVCLLPLLLLLPGVPCWRSSEASYAL